MLANPWKWDGIRNQEKEYYFSDIFSLRSKKPHRNIIIKILWAIKDQKKRYILQFRDEHKLYYCGYIQRVGQK